MQGRTKKIVKTVSAAALLLALYGLIFGFSAQDGEQSGSLSQLISERCVELLNTISGGHWSDVLRAQLAEYFEHPIRKLAHFSEYACMGVLLWVLWEQWLQKGRGLYLLITGWVLVSAAADELHQYFVPGRYASPADVLLDTCGGVCGMLCCLFLRTILVRRQSAACSR